MRSDVVLASRSLRYLFILIRNVLKFVPSLSLPCMLICSSDFFQQILLDDAETNTQTQVQSDPPHQKTPKYLLILIDRKCILRS